MLARNCDLCSLASASCRLFSSISLKRRAFWIARERQEYRDFSF
jgi:hypothetical protein